MAEETFKGKLWVITGPEGKLVDDIDTDMIYHNSYLAITDIEKMGQYAFDNLDDWKGFAKEAKPGDMVMVGANFGSGSSRQQAVDCFVSLGISCIIARSYGAIYKRNAINSGFPILTIDEVGIGDGGLVHGDEVDVSIIDGTIKKGGEPAGRLKPMAQVQLDIYRAGNLFKFARTLDQE